MMRIVSTMISWAASREIVRVLVLVVAGFLTFPGMAQTLPYHEDPSARERSAEQVTLPALRFLTTNDFPPFNYRDPSGQLVGFHVDLAQEICEVLDAVCTIQAWPWDQVADALSENQGDALIGGLALTTENAGRFDFSAIYLALPGRFVAPTAAAAGLDPLARGLKVAVRAGSAHEEFVRTYMPDAEIVPADNEIAALSMVQEQRTDVYFGDAMRAAFWLNENPQCCAFASDPFFRPDYFGAGLSIAVPNGQDRIRTAINVAIARLQRNGTFDELYLRWFPVSFY